MLAIVRSYFDQSYFRYIALYGADLAANDVFVLHVIHQQI